MRQRQLATQLRLVADNTNTDLAFIERYLRWARDADAMDDHETAARCRLIAISKMRDVVNDRSALEEYRREMDEIRREYP